MKQRQIRLIIIFSAISLAGLIITQLFWIRNAVKLGEEQFDNRVSIALQSSLDEYVQRKRGGVNDVYCGCLTVSSNPDSLFINLDPPELDSLLKVHFNYHGIDTLFNLRVVKCATGEVVFDQAMVHETKHPPSIHRISLSCLHHNESHHLEITFPRTNQLILLDLLLWLAASIIFLLTVVLCFAFILTGILRQKKISEIRNDFINNMTHEFRTPISNISLACEILDRHDLENNDARTRKYLSIIREENRRMRGQVDRVLKFAQKNHDDLSIRLEETDMHELLKESVEHVCLTECLHGTRVDFDLKAQNPIVMADPVHFSNIISNLLDNAQKYCTHQPEIRISTQNFNQKFVIEFQDNGIGISQDAQKRIFDKFYRVPTGDVHNVKGFGLGLYYVKTMIEEHGGTIRVISSAGEGTRFVITLAQSNHGKA